MLNRYKYFVTGSHLREYLSKKYVVPHSRYSSKTAPAPSQENPKPDSIFSNQGSLWDRVFLNVEDSPISPSAVSFQPRNRPQQSMTARESRVFNEMFEMIFNAAQESSTTSPSSAIGLGRGGVDDLIGKLRKHPRRLKLSTESDELFDRQKEAVDLCNSDQELLEWAVREVFGESQRYEEVARKAISQATESGISGGLPTLQPPTYPQLIALLIRTFRDKYKDPYLALSVFDHARHLSIASYVFGCSTQAYNELIETRWKCFYDLKGVHGALEEMKVNGVKFDSRTRKLVERVRREAGEQNLRLDVSGLSNGEVWDMLAKIENLVSKTSRVSSGSPTAAPKEKEWDGWKTSRLEDIEGDEWGFNQWDKPYSTYIAKGNHRVEPRIGRLG